MKKISLFFLLATVWLMPANAEKVSEQEAREAAQAFFANNVGAKKSRALAAENNTLQLSHSAASYYAFNRGENAGFVLVAADDRFAKNILGYADQGSFDVNNMPDNMRWWLGEYDRALNAAKVANVNAAKAIAQAETAVERAEIAPLVTAKWDQSSPFNDMCPVYNNIRCPSGCLATALAQIIYCNKYPEQGVGTASYDWTVNLVSQGTLSTDFGDHSYNYDIMKDTYGATSSAESRQAVAQLLYDLGVLSKMAYKPAISSAPTFTALLGLVNHLKYDKSAIIRTREFYTDQEWIDMVYANLAEGYPLCYTGQNENAGHAFVCDGYRDGYFHINWGWSGGSNGYFLLDALDPTTQGIGSSSGGYNDGQEAIFNLKPLQNNSKYEVLMYNYYNFDITEKQQTNTSIATFTGAFNNLGIAAQTIVLGVKVVDSNGNITWIQEQTSSNLNSLASAGSIVVDLSKFPTTSGKYRVYPAYQDENGVWKEMRTKKNFAKSYLIATVSGKNIKFDCQLKFSNWTVSDKIVAEKQFSAQVTIQNSTETNFGDLIKLALMAYGTDSIVGYSDEVAVYAAVGNSTTASFTMTAPAEHGFYNYFVVDSKGEVISDVQRLWVEENTETSDEYKLSLASVEVTHANANNVALNNVKFTATITCESGRYNGFVAFYIYPENGGNYLDYLYQDFYIRAGETKTATSSAEFYGLQVGKTYCVKIYYNDAVASKWIRLGTSDQDLYFSITKTQAPNFTITTSVNDASLGTVTAGGEYQENTQITLTATPATGCRFVQWSDGNTDNPRTVTVVANTEYTAIFEDATVALEATEIANALIAKHGTIYGTKDMRIINLLGQDVTHQNGALSSGIYLVRIGNKTQKVWMK